MTEHRYKTCDRCGSRGEEDAIRDHFQTITGTRAWDLCEMCFGALEDFMTGTRAKDAKGVAPGLATTPNPDDFRHGLSGEEWKNARANAGVPVPEIKSVGIGAPPAGAEGAANEPDV